MMCSRHCLGCDLHVLCRAECTQSTRSWPTIGEKEAERNLIKDLRFSLPAQALAHQIFGAEQLYTVVEKIAAGRQVVQLPAPSASLSNTRPKPSNPNPETLNPNPKTLNPEP